MNYFVFKRWPLVDQPCMVYFIWALSQKETQESELSSTTKRKDVKSVEREVRVYQEVLTGGVGVNVDQNTLYEFSKN